MLEWITDPNVMSVSDQIEEVNRKMFDKIRSRNDNLVVFFCKSLTFYYLLFISTYFVTQKFAARVRPHFSICFSSFFSCRKRLQTMFDCVTRTRKYWWWSRRCRYFFYCWNLLLLAQKLYKYTHVPTYMIFIQKKVE